MIDRAAFLDRFFRTVPAETCGAKAEVLGRLPDFLRGTFYINGPGRFGRGGRQATHWLDGDGLLCAVQFRDDGVSYTTRFVRTEKFVAEEQAGRPLYRSFGTAYQDDRLLRGIALASPINVSVYPFARTLLAFGEQGLPWELDPASLETRGPFTFDGALNDLSPFSAHPKRDAETGQLFNFGVSYSASHPMLNVYCFEADGSLRTRRRIPLDYPRSVHDFGVTTRHLVFYLSPYLLDIGVMTAGGTVMDAFSWRPDLGSRLLILSRDTGRLVTSIGIGSCYCLHFVNCHDEGDELVVDVIEYDRPIYDEYRIPSLFETIGHGRPVRLVADVDGERIARRQASGYDCAPDFPCIDPTVSGQSCDEFWALGISAAGQRGRKFFDQLVHVRWAEPHRPAVYQAEEGRFFTGEPALVPAARSDEAALICPMYDAVAHRTALAVFDPQHIARGPFASVLVRPIPPLFHSSFARDAV